MIAPGLHRGDVRMDPMSDGLREGLQAWPWVVAASVHWVVSLMRLHDGARLIQGVCVLLAIYFAVCAFGGLVADSQMVPPFAFVVAYVGAFAVMARHDRPERSDRP